MKTILKNVRLIENGDKRFNVSVENKRIAMISEDNGLSCGVGDEIINGNGNLLIPGFFNAHGHSAMTSLRGYADDLPLQRWLFEKIFPAEDRLYGDVVYYASLLAIAEMLAGGTVCFSDMYFFMDRTAQAVIESGIKANLCRGFTSSPETNMLTDLRFSESKKLISDYNGYDDGRIISEMSIHAEYTNSEAPVKIIAEYAKENNLGVQIHLSETNAEHNECISRHGVTPAEWFLSLGVFDSPCCAAHCVYLSDNDMKILASKNVSAIHNPISNLKLGSGVMQLNKLINYGINVALGTDGAASNNRLDMLRELQTAAVLHKGINRDPIALPAKQIFEMATQNGAVAQRRKDCGEIKVGNRADLVLLNCDTPHNLPLYDNYSMVAYSAQSSDVMMTMVDGKLLYQNGEYKTIDIEKVKFQAKSMLKGFFN